MNGNGRQMWAHAALAGTIALGCVAQRTQPHGLGSVKTAEAATARAATARGDWQTAACSWYAIFEAGGEDSARACCEAARALCELGDAQSARGVLEQGLARQPRHPDLLEMQGTVLCALGFRRAAETSYGEALEVDPRRSSALLGLARVRMELGLENAAIQPLERRIAAGDGDAETFALLARALGRLGRDGEAFEAHARAFALGPAAPAELIAAARLYVESDELRGDARAAERATAWLEHAVDLDPQSTQAHYSLAQIDELRGDDARAVERYRRAIETDPCCVAALTKLAQLHARQGEHEAAAAMARRALALEKDAERRAALERLLAPPAPALTSSKP